MKSLLNFLYKYNHLLLFVIIELLCFSFIVKYNNYHRVVFLNSSNSVSGFFYEKSSIIKNYFNLQKINDGLASENARLRNQLRQIKESDIYLKAVVPIDSSITRAITARVINNSVNKHDNYITLNKGYKDGVRPDMGVISSDGVVGVVVNVSRNYSTVLSVLNERWSVNAKLLKSNNFGTLKWDGNNPRQAVLSEIPYHVEVNEGDTVVTSGFSTIFPEGINIGTATLIEYNSGDNFKKIWVQLSVDFSNVNYVEVIESRIFKERLDLEKLTNNE
jgi:rod shape-determining protein MreC